MVTLALPGVVVLVTDQVVKLLLRHRRFESVPLGPLGSLRIVEGRLWLHRLTDRSPIGMWLWIVSAGALVAGSAWLPASRLFVGLLLGGSLSNGLEGAVRGSVTDYVCLRFWPAFNLADVALTVGAIGIAIELLRAIGGIAA